MEAKSSFIEKSVAVGIAGVMRAMRAILREGNEGNFELRTFITDY